MLYIFNYDLVTYRLSC